MPILMDQSCKVTLILALIYVGLKAALGSDDSPTLKVSASSLASDSSPARQRTAEQSGVKPPTSNSLTILEDSHAFWRTIEAQLNALEQLVSAELSLAQNLKLERQQQNCSLSELRASLSLVQLELRDLLELTSFDRVCRLEELQYPQLTSRLAGSLPPPASWRGEFALWKRLHTNRLSAALNRAERLYERCATTSGLEAANGDKANSLKSPLSEPTNRRELLLQQRPILNESANSLFGKLANPLPALFG